MKGWLLGGVLVLLVLGFSPGAAAKPRHQGFTGDLGIGLSLMLVPHHSYSECFGSAEFCAGADVGEHTETRSEIGLAPLSLGLGGYITPSVALLARASGTSYFDDGDQIVHNFYGAIVEVWPAERFYVSAGVGFALFGYNPWVSAAKANTEGGWALDFRAGAALAGGTNHDFTLSLEAIPGFYGDDIVTGFGLVGAWKWY